MTIEFPGYDRPTRLGSSTRLSTMDIDGMLTFQSRCRRHADDLVMGAEAAGVLKLVGR
jgi:hypothetical protein